MHPKREWVDSGCYHIRKKTPSNRILCGDLLFYIQNQLLSSKNPHGTLTNSDLELTALLVGTTLAAASQPILHPHIFVASDNFPAVSYANKGSTTSKAAHAFLLHQLAWLRHANPFTLYVVFMPGSTNSVADCCSCSFHMTDMDFLDYIKKHLPYATLLETCPPTNWTSIQNELSLVHKSTVAGISAKAQQVTSHRTSGHPFVDNLTKTHLSKTLMILYHYFNCLLNNTDLAWLLPAGLQSTVGHWKVPFAPWEKCMLHWDIQIQD